MIQLLALNFKPMKALAEIHRQFPEHREEGEAPLRRAAIQYAQHTRKEEIAELRAKLNETVADRFWIATKQGRMQALQNMFEDANRWIPKRILRRGEGADANDMVVYEKDIGTLAKIVAQARDEMGEDGLSRQAQSLEDIVRLAEQERNLEVTEEIDVTPEGGAVPASTDEHLLDVPNIYPSAGNDDERGFLAGDTDIPEIVPPDRQDDD